MLVIVSHDRELLGLVDQIADLSAGSVRMYGGNLEAYEDLLATEQAAAERAVATAAADVRREHRDLVDAQIKQARRDRQGRKVAASGSLPRIVASARKRSAQESACRSRELHAERLSRAPAAAARRADQQPGPGLGPPALPGAGGLRRRDPGRQSRPALPALGRDHPLAPPGP